MEQEALYDLESTEVAQQRYLSKKFWVLALMFQLFLIQVAQDISPE